VSESKSIGDEFRDESRKAVGELQRLRDEIKLQLHLAGADARDAWEKLEPALRQFEERVERASETALDEVRAKGSELKGELEQLFKKIRKS
jgi:hypothetical protein